LIGLRVSTVRLEGALAVLLVAALETDLPLSKVGVLALASRAALYSRDVSDGIIGVVVQSLHVLPVRFLFLAALVVVPVVVVQDKIVLADALGLFLMLPWTIPVVSEVGQHRHVRSLEVVKVTSDHVWLCASTRVGMSHYSLILLLVDWSTVVTRPRLRPLSVHELGSLEASLNGSVLRRYTGNSSLHIRFVFISSHLLNGVRWLPRVVDGPEHVLRLHL